MHLFSKHFKSAFSSMSLSETFTKRPSEIFHGPDWRQRAVRGISVSFALFPSEMCDVRC